MTRQPSAIEQASDVSDTSDFGAMSRRQQLVRVRRSAVAAIERFGLGDASLRLVNHDFNTTYRVVTNDGVVRALRVNLNSAYDVDQVEAEVEWVSALADHPEFDVPGVVTAPDGATVVAVDCEGFESPRPAVLYDWLPGTELAERNGPGYEQLGVAMASLHTHTERWRGRLSARRPVMTSVFLDDPDRIRPGHPWIDDPVRTRLTATLDELEQLLEPVFAAETQLVHGDLHGANAKWHRGRLGVFDFDDCGIGTRLQDLATSVFYVRDNPRLEDAIVRGYRRVRPLPPHRPEEFEALLLSRNLLLLNYLLESVTAEMEEFVPGYLERTMRRVDHFESTGRFELAP